MERQVSTQETTGDTSEPELDYRVVGRNLRHVGEAAILTQRSHTPILPHRKCHSSRFAEVNSPTHPSTYPITNMNNNLTDSWGNGHLRHDLSSGTGTKAHSGGRYGRQRRIALRHSRTRTRDTRTRQPGYEPNVNHVTPQIEGELSNSLLGYRGTSPIRNYHPPRTTVGS